MLIAHADTRVGRCTWLIDSCGSIVLIIDLVTRFRVVSRVLLGLPAMTEPTSSLLSAGGIAPDKVYAYCGRLMAAVFRD